MNHLKKSSSFHSFSDFQRKNIASFLQSRINFAKKEEAL